MPNRRKFLTHAFGAGLGLAGLPLASPIFLSPAFANYTAPKGFHHQDWFKRSTMDLREDQKAAAKDGKMLVLLWEQRGCTYCKQMHEIAFQYEEIVNLAKANFYVIQMDLRGDRSFVDFKGEKKTEAEISKALSVTFTPTTQFLDNASKEVFRMPGYANPPIFKAVYEFVIEKGYENDSFRDWVKKRVTG
ncbi:MAG: thioredoxin fold domain-containing protein [Rhodospirillales bacterium]|nr:thioredoxin fold domain-containing protein [Rhodospirillales bacterium]